MERDLLGLKKPSLENIQACLDDILCNAFPGKLPHEFDDIDYGRLMRMFQVRSVKSAEIARSRWLEGKLAHKDISEEQWEIIGENDGIYEQWQLAKKP